AAIFHGIGSGTDDNSAGGPKAWRVATVDLIGTLDSGVANVYLQIGLDGMNHFNEYSATTNVVFGNFNDRPYNAVSERHFTDKSQDTPDLIVTGVPSAGALGDLNLDGQVNSADIQAMFKALTDRNAYQSLHPGLTNEGLLAIADFDLDGQLTNAD